MGNPYRLPLLSPLLMNSIGGKVGKPSSPIFGWPWNGMGIFFQCKSSVLCLKLNVFIEKVNFIDYLGYTVVFEKDSVLSNQCAGAGPPSRTAGPILS